MAKITFKFAECELCVEGETLNDAEDKFKKMLTYLEKEEYIIEKGLRRKMMDTEKRKADGSYV